MADRFRAYNASGDVIAAAAVNKSGAAKFDAGIEVISKVVFYSGDEENEAVVGSVDVDHSGPIDVALEAEGVVSAAGLATGAGS